MIRGFRKIFFLSLMGLIASSFFSICWAQISSKKSHKIKYLSLFIGVIHDEKVPLMPINYKRTGVYKKLTKVQYERKKKFLRFTPTKKGDGTLFIVDADTENIIYEFRFDIKKTNLEQVARKMRYLLDEIDGISFEIINNKVVVDGQVLLTKEISRIHEVVAQFGNKASSLVTLSPAASKHIARIIEREIGNPEIRVRASNGIFILEGWAKDEDEKDKAFILAQSYIPDVVSRSNSSPVSSRRKDPIVNFIKIRDIPTKDPPKKLIQVDINYVELQKNYTKGFRFQWTPSLGDNSTLQFSTGGRSPAGLVSTITGTISNLIPKLNWAREHGRARILKSTSLIIQEGKAGLLNAVTKVPYTTINSQGQPVTIFTEGGLKTNVTPTIIGERSNSIQMDVKFQFTAFTAVASGIPSTESRDMTTVLVIRSGESAAVGGVITNDTASDFNKAPPLAVESPILSLYASKDFRNNRSQFVVFITPTIKSSASENSQRIKNKFRIK